MSWRVDRFIPQKGEAIRQFTIGKACEWDAIIAINATQDVSRKTKSEGIVG